MKKICICPSPSKPNALKYIKAITSFLQQGGMEVFIDDEAQNDHNLNVIDENTPLDTIITLGGDGTLIHYRKKYSHLPNVDYTAVNLGGLGFMADVRVDEIEKYLQDLIDSKYVVDERIMLEGQRPDGNLLHAVNDLVIHRGSIRSMIQLKVTINNEHFNTFQADGIIISTPTGSSAYSLACGGPLMHPKLTAILLTTISGHTLTNRPFAVPKDSVIEVEYLSDSDEAVDATADGIETFKLKGGETMKVFSAKERFRLIHYNCHSFYETVRKKLHWRGKSIS